ncbi:helix-hairpin-helix domain-containing protein [Bacillus rubiinfantis]|uniref:helix-hairpin-helix domain-containing protein n=1 Tax=Bacillus rubiinfantis TaxID=1499680 RepID=UPI001FE6B0E7|nr:helix-hairpin-helix domain-containing protein [Bacillus rubiinfantis]
MNEIYLLERMNPMKEWLLKYKLPVAAGIILLIGGSYFYVNEYEQDNPMSIAQNESELQTSAASGQEKVEEKDEVKQTETIMVDVKGQIKRPGVYQASSGERVIDVINRAGGVTEKADKTQVNFAEHVQDEMVIYIPAQGEEGLAAPSSLGGNEAIMGATANHQGKVNLNKADETELQKLPGIGPAKAAAIIEYRQSNGGFNTVEDLKNVSGIGDKTFEKLQDLVDIR